VRALDLFCGAGGATKGLQQAGFHVTGVDINPQPNYCGDEFIQGDALTFLCSFVGGSRDGYPEICDRCGRHWDYAGHREFDFIWASPPCQRYSECTPIEARANHPDLIDATREKLQAAGKPYAIENVDCARHKLRDPFYLCGTMFGMNVWRHRWFETHRVEIGLRPPCKHNGHPILVCGSGHGRGEAKVHEMIAAMNVPWMKIRREARQAIPPAYSKFIAESFLKTLKAAA
jgi:hypothetical protein